MSLDSIYSKIIEERGGVASIHSAFSSFPKGIAAHYQFYKEIMLEEDLPLARRDREYLAVITSRSNECPYCITHHEEALKNSSNGFVVSDKDNFWMQLAVSLTKEPWKSQLLQAEAINHGISDSEFQHAVMVVSYFNFVNRCAHAMGIEVEANFEETCK